MIQIRVINKLILDKTGLKVRDKEGHLTLVHQRQGTLDGACGVYSVIMGLLIMGYLSGKDLGKIDRRSPEGKLLSKLLEEQGMVIDGYFSKTLSRDINEYAGNIAHTHYPNGDIEKYLSYIHKYIDNDLPLVLCIGWPNEDYGHYVLAIGYEMTDNTIPKVLCLDPSYDASSVCYWNCCIDVSKSSHWHIDIKGISNKCVLENMIAFNVSLN